MYVRTDLAFFDDFGIFTVQQEVNLFEKIFRRLSGSADVSIEVNSALSI